MSRLLPPVPVCGRLLIIRRRRAVMFSPHHRNLTNTVLQPRRTPVGCGVALPPTLLRVLQRVWMRSGAQLRQHHTLLAAFTNASHLSMMSGAAASVVIFRAVCTAVAAPRTATAAAAAASLLAAVEYAIPQIFQLRFFAISRRLRKISKTTQRYRQAFCYVRPPRRAGLLGRYVAAFFNFDAARTYGQRQKRTLISLGGIGATAQLVYHQQQSCALASLLKNTADA